RRATFRTASVVPKKSEGPEGPSLATDAGELVAATTATVAAISGRRTARSRHVFWLDAVALPASDLTTRIVVVPDRPQRHRIAVVHAAAELDGNYSAVPKLDVAGAEILTFQGVNLIVQ